MTKKTRFIILLVCVVCFAVGVPYLVLYSMGYRIDFAHMKVIATGGIYVRSFPAADEIIIDSKNIEKPGIFANDIFVPNLLPRNHSILIEKAGYYDYSKILPVQEKLATKLENVVLFKKDLAFQVVTDKTQNPFTLTAAGLPQDQSQKYIVKNNNLYYSSAPENSSLASSQKNTAAVKNLAAFAISGSNIVWLGGNGFLYQADQSTLSLAAGKIPVKLTDTALKIAKKGSYKIIIYGQNTFVNDNGDLLLLDSKTNKLENFAGQVADAKISPDGLNIVYSTNSGIYISLLADPKQEKMLLYKTSDAITDLQWLNDSYIIFADGNKIIISEIDYRGKINTVELAQSVKLADGTTLNITSPKIYFNSQEDKLYILTQNTLLASEKLMP